MIYIINGNVKYNSSDGTLFCTDNSLDMITLTRVTSELLLLLITYNASPLSRDAILSELWEKRGLSASSNNLNNHVSMLRKVLVQCGCLDLITTIPKYGFLFNAEVSVMDERSRPQKESLVRASLTGKDESEPEISANRIKCLSGLFSRQLKIAIILASFLVIIYSPMIYNYFRLQSIRTEISSIDQCRFYLADDKTRAMGSDTTIKTIKMIINNEKLNCQRKANIYYFFDKKSDASNQIITNDLLSYCLYDSKAPCENYVVSRYENKI